MVIQSQNIIDCPRSFMGQISFWENQIFQSCHIYNQKEDWVNNEIYTGD